MKTCDHLQLRIVVKMVTREGSMVCQNLLRNTGELGIDTPYIKIVSWNLPVTVVMESIVTGHCNQSTPGWSKRVKYLCSCISPHLKKTSKMFPRNMNNVGKSIISFTIISVITSKMRCDVNPVASSSGLNCNGAMCYLFS